MHVVRVIKPTLSKRSSLLCGLNIRAGIIRLDNAIITPSVRQAFAEVASGGVMPKQSKTTTVIVKKTPAVPLDGRDLPASFSTEECTEASLLIQAHATHGPLSV